MSRNASGTYTLPGGVNPVVTGTTITINWANTTLNDLATEMTDSLDRSGKGAMLAQLKAIDGTGAAPGITFGSDLDSGLWRGVSGVGMNVNTVAAQVWTDAAVSFQLPVTCEDDLVVDGETTLVQAVVCEDTLEVQGQITASHTSGIDTTGVSNMSVSNTTAALILTNVGTGAPLTLTPRAAVTGLADGDIWVETGTNTLKVRINGATKTVTLT